MARMKQLYTEIRERTCRTIVEVGTYNGASAPPPCRFQDFAGVHAGHPAIFDYNFTVHHRVVNASRFLDHPGFVPRQVLNILGLQSVDRRGVEHHEISGHTRSRQAAVIKPEN